MAIRLPQFITLTAGVAYPVNQGWKNIALFPGTGGSITVTNSDGSTMSFTGPITLGGSGDNSFNLIWGSISLTANTVNARVIIDGDVATLSGSGSSGGSTIYGFVNTWADLPVGTGPTDPQIDAIMGVRTTTGTWPFNEKEAGFWRRATMNGNLNDWVYFANFTDAFADNHFTIYNATDNSKRINFDASAIATGQTRTITMANADVNLQNVAAAASASNNGYLSSTDWATFNSKEPYLGVPVADGYALVSTVAGVRSWVPFPSTSPLTTKGDLYTYSTTNDRLPVGTNNQFLRANSGTATGLEWHTLTSGDIPALPYVSSVGLALPSSLFSVSGSPVTGSGTLTGNLINQSANTVFAGPATGSAAAPSFRALVSGDIPNITNAASNVLTGYVSGTGTITATDTILTAIQKLNGNSSAIISSQWITNGSDIYYALGNVLIGSSGTPVSKLHTIDTTTTVGVPRGLVADQYNNGVNSSQFNLRKARGTFALPTVISSGDVLSNINSWGYDGANFINASAIRVTSVGTIGTARIPTKMGFYTMTDVTTGVLTLALELDQAQVATFASNIISGGYLSLPQLTVSAIPSSGFFLYADSSGRLTWKGTNGWLRTFDGTANTADQIYTLPNYSGTVGVVNSSGSIPGLVDQAPIFIQGPTNNTYYIGGKMEFAGTINGIYGLLTTSGTCTLAIQINGVNVTGLSSLSVTSSTQDATASAANTFAIGDIITVVISSSSAPAFLRATLKITRS